MKKDVKLTRVLHCVGSMKRAGAETFIMNMYRNIDRSMVQFDFLCCEKVKGDYDDEILDLGGRIYYTENEKYIFPGKLIYLGKILRFRNAFLKHPKDTIVHIHGHHAFDIYLIVLGARLAGMQKIIVHSHNTYVESHVRLHKMCKHLVSGKDITELACSKMAGEWMFANDKFVVVSNGIEVSRFIYDQSARNHIREELGLMDKFVIGHVGRFEEQKNHIFLIELFNEFAKAHSNSVLLLIGDGPLKPVIMNRIRQYALEDKVEFLGIRSDVDKLYSAMDAFCFPSFFEGLGIVAVEAESSDLPCLFSDTIPKDIDITDKVFRCSLNGCISEWVKGLEKCKSLSDVSVRRNNLQLISDRGFEARESSDALFKIYTTM